MNHAMPDADKPIGVCVDDFGLHAHVDEAAIALAEQGRVSAISCMTTAPQWHLRTDGLAGVGSRVDIGLHLNLTDPAGAARGWRRRLRPLIAAAYAGRLDGAVLRHEIQVQLDAFEDALGVAPDFVDGHQHVHQLPVVREVLVAELSRRYAGRSPWIRNTAAPKRGGGLSILFDADRRKHAVIEALGAGPMAALAARHGFRQNSHLLGVYGFGVHPGGHIARMAGWCAQAGPLDLMMCHPASRPPSDDPIGAARAAEFATLRSDRYSELMARHRLRVTRLTRVLSTSEARSAAATPAGCRPR